MDDRCGMLPQRPSGVQAKNIIVIIIVMNRYISDAASLSFGTYNVNGLSKLKKNLILNTDFDLISLTETHGWRDDDLLSVYSDIPGRNDRWSGTAILLSNRLANYVMSQGCIGSRIAYCRLRGLTCNLFIISVYIPQRKRKAPDQNDTYNELESLLAKVGQRDCVILMGDFNSRLSRNIPGKTGRWCIHTHRDSGGDRLLEIMTRFELRCVSTYFQPRKNHSNATYLNVQTDKPPSQIDHVIVSNRWATSVRSCEVKWGLSMQFFGRKYDHGLIQFKFKLRLKSLKRKSRKDFASLKDPTVTAKHNELIDNFILENERPADVNAQWPRLVKCMQNAQSAIPKATRNGKHAWNTSARTLSLLKQREEIWDRLNDDQRKQLKRAISRSARNDYRDYVANILTDIEKEDRIGNCKEVFRLTKSLSNKRKGNQFVQPSVDIHGNEIETTEQQLDAWAEFLEPKFAARANEPIIDLSDNAEIAEPSITLDEVKICVQKLKSGKAHGPDQTPIEQFKSSDSATYELFHLLSSIFETETIPTDFALADMLMQYKKEEQGR